ncbi:hypothetical protein EXIGLDRAFT_719584 [Exidia glandulosa HHB12029]|uniref:Uncharacterized protein n=1 Tax=Exidia glandulosa HHB12029 TaxID=1314781 RepID=A0A165GZ90_EXIGL|nr:hypothetical protein EXIGLDRAFT_719584 [Exidia glandulosa HHB12029]
MRYVYTLAEKWGDVLLGEEQAQLRLILNQMHGRGETNTVAQRPLLFLPDDVPIGELTPDVVIARFDKREARARATGEQQQRQHNVGPAAKRPRVDGP